MYTLVISYHCFWKYYLNIFIFTVYINHRPAFGLEPDKLSKVFDILGVSVGGGKPAIERGELLDMLQKNGKTTGKRSRNEKIHCISEIYPVIMRNR